MSLNRLRYKIFTSFALSALGAITIVRLWSVAPPSLHMFGPYLAASVLVVAAFWRGVIFARMAGSGAK
jgi:hypothetical protein